MKQQFYDPGSGHLAIRVQDFDSMLANLRRAGIAATSEPILLQEPECWRGAKCVYITDPDGVTIELVERTARR